MKTRIYAAPAVQWLSLDKLYINDEDGHRA